MKNIEITCTNSHQTFMNANISTAASVTTITATRMIVSRSQKFNPSPSPLQHRWCIEYLTSPWRISRLLASNPHQTSMNTNISTAASVTATRIIISRSQKFNPSSNSLQHRWCIEYLTNPWQTSRLLGQLTSNIHEHEYLYCCLSNQP